MDVLKEFLQGWPGVVSTGLASGGIYKIVDRILENRDKQRARDDAAEDARAMRAAAMRDADDKADAERIRDLEAQLIPLSKQAAAAEYLKAENDRLNAKDSQWDERFEQMKAGFEKQLSETRIELIQAQTVANGYATFSQFFGDPDVSALLTLKFQEWKRKALESPIQ